MDEVAAAAAVEAMSIEVDEEELAPAGDNAGLHAVGGARHEGR